LCDVPVVGVSAAEIEVGGVIEEVVVDEVAGRTEIDSNVAVVRYGVSCDVVAAAGIPEADSIHVVRACNVACNGVAAGR